MAACAYISTRLTMKRLTVVVILLISGGEINSQECTGQDQQCQLESSCCEGFTCTSFTCVPKDPQCQKYGLCQNDKVCCPGYSCQLIPTSTDVAAFLPAACKKCSTDRESCNATMKCCPGFSCDGDESYCVQSLPQTVPLSSSLDQQTNKLTTRETASSTEDNAPQSPQNTPQSFLNGSDQPGPKKMYTKIQPLQPPQLSGCPTTTS